MFYDCWITTSISNTVTAVLQTPFSDSKWESRVLTASDNHEIPLYHMLIWFLCNTDVNTTE